MIRARFDGPRDWDSALPVDVAKALSTPMPCEVTYARGKATGEHADASAKSSLPVEASAPAGAKKRRVSASVISFRPGTLAEPSPSSTRKSSGSRSVRRSAG